MFVKGRGGGPQHQFGAYPATLRRGAEQVFEFHVREVASRGQPLPLPAAGGRRFGRRLLDGGANAQPVRLIVLNAERGSAESLEAAVFRHEIDVGPILPGWRFRSGWKGQRE